jgi:EKC/KEOPS complex subunit CGI121/TPRKB
MESYTLSQFPAPYSTVHLALFRNLRNASTIRTRLVEAATMPGPEGEEARKRVEFGFVEAAHVRSFHRPRIPLTRSLHPRSTS